MWLRRARWCDLYLVWRWRNAPDVRQAMRRQDPIPWRQHVRWFRSVQRGRTQQLFVVSYWFWPIGSVRLDAHGHGEMELDIVMAPSVRGNGYGTRAIRLASREAQRCGATRVVAWVRIDNTASRGAFLRAGYLERSHGPHVQEGFRVLVWPN